MHTQTTTYLLNSDQLADVAVRHTVPLPPEVPMIFGFFAVAVTLLCLTHQRGCRESALTLAVCLLFTAGYALLISAWPLAVLQLGYALLTFRRAYRLPWHRALDLQKRRAARAAAGSPAKVHRLFGSGLSDSERN